MAWIESHQSLGTHKKLYKLATLLNISRPQAVGHLQFLWWWALDNAPDGCLKGIPQEVISDVSVWPGDKTQFINALKEAGWIDKETEYLHDWHDYAGKLLRHREDDKERHRTSFGTPAELLKKSIATVPYSTVPNSTIKERVKKESNNLLPEWIDKKAWDAFIDMRKKMKKVPTARGVELLIIKLSNFRKDGEDIKAVIEQSIMNNWQGLFPVHKDGRSNGTHQKDTGISRVEKLRASVTKPTNI